MKYIISAVSFAALSVLLSGCGGDDNSIDSSVNSDNSNSADEIRYSLIAENYSSNNTTYAIREDYVLRDGQFQSTQKIVKGNREGDSDDFFEAYYGNNFSSTFKGNDNQYSSLIGSTIDVLSPTKFSYQLKSESNAKTLTFTNELKAFDISGITAADEARFYVDPLYEFELTSATFPVGSICYDFVDIRPSFDVFEIYNDEPRTETSIEDWVDRQLQLDSSLTTSDIVMVGENNEYRAISLIQNGENRFSAVEIDGNIYTGSLETTNGYQTSTDPDISRVECSLFNDIAADYLEDQIKQNGKIN